MRNLNLQFFADESADVDVSTGVEVSESAEPMEVEETANEWVSEANATEESAEESTEEVVEETEEPKPVDENAIAAAARRRTEAEFKRRQEERDAEIARRFGHLKNPITGEQVTTEKAYWAALDAQEQVKNERELREKGVDPELINAMVQNNPAVREANAYLENVKQQEAMNMINADIAELSKMDANIHSLNDVPAEVIEYAMKYQVPLTDAYMVKNFGKITSSKEEAIRQSAINQAKNKAHLAPVNGVAQTDNSVEIPQHLRSMWEEAFPNKTWAERKKLYNEQLNQ